MNKSDLSEFVVKKIDKMLSVIKSKSSPNELSRNVYEGLIEDHMKRPYSSLIALLIAYEKHLKASSNYTEANEMERLYQSQFFDVYPTDIRSTYFLDSEPLDILSRCMEEDIYPPPELLRLISTNFSVYFSSDGSIELEEVFFGKSKGKGNHSYQKYREREYLEFSKFCSNELFFSPRDEKKPTLSELYKRFKSGSSWAYREFSPDKITEITIEQIEHEETFLRGFRRWKKGK